MIRSIFLGFVFLFTSPLDTFASWSTPAPIETGTNVKNTIVNTCYNSTDDQIFATFTNMAGDPLYSIYSGGAWSTPAPIDMSSSVLSNISLCYDSTHNRVFAAWVLSTLDVLASIYSGGTWSGSPSDIGSMQGGENVSLSYDSAADEVLAVWPRLSDTSFPYYNIYGSGMWGSPTRIEMTSAANGDIFTCYDPSTQQVFAAWQDTSTNYPTYMIKTAGVWSAPATIESSFHSSNVFLTYDSQTQQVVATWANTSNMNVPTYAFYNPSAMPQWTATSFAIGSFAQVDVCTCFDSASNKLFAAWANGSANPTAAIYSNGNWGSPELIDTDLTDVSTSVYLTYDSTHHRVFATWIDTNTHLPMFSIYTPSPSSSKQRAFDRPSNNR